MKCAVEHDLYIKETEEHEAMLQQEFLERAYEEAFEYASQWADEDTWQYFGRCFKIHLQEAGLDHNEICECIDWLSEDKRMEWE